MLITRQAIIIGAPGADDLPASALYAGVLADYVTYERFLKLPCGGAWTKGEITSLWQPDPAKLIQWLHSITADYALTVFCGHGALVQGHAVIEVAPNTVPVYVRDFRTASRRQLTIIDACKKSVNSATYLLKEAREDAGLGAPLNPYWASCRARYDAAIMDVGEMTALWNGCSPGQAAGSNPEGGYFSRTLLTYCEVWAEKTKSRDDACTQTGRIREIDQVVGPKVTNEHYPQKPTLESGRDHTSFPFVVA